MKFLLSIVFLFQSSWGRQNLLPPASAFENAVINPLQQPGSFVLSVDDYEDVRVDTDLDGKIDFWRIQKAGLTVEIFFSSNNLSRYLIRKLDGNIAHEISYKQEGKILVLESARSRSLFEMNYTDGDKICADVQEGFKKELTAIGSIEGAVFPALAMTLVEPSCKAILGKGYVEVIQYLMNYVKGNDSLAECIQKNDFKSSLPPGKDTSLFVDVLKTNYALQRAQLVKNTEKYKPLISCTSQPDERRTKESITISEGGKITFSVPPQIRDVSIEPKKMQHELLHRAGIFSEESIKNVMATCASLKDKKIANHSTPGGFATPGNADAGSQAAAATTEAKIPKPLTKPNDTLTGAKVSSSSGIETGAKSNTSSTSAEKKVSPPPPEKFQGSVNAAKTSTANIPKSLTVAQTNIPTAEALSEPIYSNPQKTTAGIETAYKNSTAQSNGVFKTANNLVGAMNSPVEAATLASNTAQKRELASATAALQTQISGGKIVASGNEKIMGVTSRNTINSNETVVESITLDGAPPAKIDSGNVPRSVASVSAGGNTNAVQRKGQQTPSGNTANSAESSAGSAAQVNPVESNAGGTLPSSVPRNTQRQPAAASRGTVNRNPETGTTSRDEVVTFISRGDYEVTKRRLKEPRFTKQLESQNITVLDLYGNSYGAKKGDLIFLDQGDKFVQQK